MLNFNSILLVELMCKVYIAVLIDRIFDFLRVKIYQFRNIFLIFIILLNINSTFRSFTELVINYLSIFVLSLYEKNLFNYTCVNNQ